MLAARLTASIGRITSYYFLKYVGGGGLTVLMPCRCASPYGRDMISEAMGPQNI
jgi:hypothetical protein